MYCKIEAFMKKREGAAAELSVNPFPTKAGIPRAGVQLAWQGAGGWVRRVASRVLS